MRIQAQNTKYMCIYVTHKRWLVPTATPLMARDTQHTQTETMLRFRLHRKLLSYCYYSSTNCISCCQFPWSNFIMSPMHCQDNISSGHPQSYEGPLTRPWLTRNGRRKGFSDPGKQTWSRVTWHITRGSMVSFVTRLTQHIRECSLSLS